MFNVGLLLLTLLYSIYLEPVVNRSKEVSLFPDNQMCICGQLLLFFCSYSTHNSPRDNPMSSTEAVNNDQRQNRVYVQWGFFFQQLSHWLCFGNIRIILDSVSSLEHVVYVRHTKMGKAHKEVAKNISKEGQTPSITAAKQTAARKKVCCKVCRPHICTDCLWQLCTVRVTINLDPMLLHQIKKTNKFHN